MQINRKYFQKSNTVYVFPVGFIQNNDVFDKEFRTRYGTWYKRVVAENKYKPIGIENINDSVASYQYYRSYEIPPTAIYINDSSVLGGLWWW